MTTIEIGDAIAKYRKEKGLSQSDLARALDIKPQAVQKWEKGLSSPRPERIHQIAGALGIPAQELIVHTNYDYLTEQVLRSAVDFIENDRFEAGPSSPPRMPERRRPRGLPTTPLIPWELAGLWAEHSEELGHDVIQWLNFPGARPERTFCLKITDESAVAPAGLKSYLPGELVVVDMTAAPKNRSTIIVELTLGSRAVLRQYLTDGDKILLKTINPEWPGTPLVELPPNARILGTVIGKWVPE